MSIDQLKAMNHRQLANEIRNRARELGDAIEAANGTGLIVQLEVWFHDGGESITLNDLSGELSVNIGRYEEL